MGDGHRASGRRRAQAVDISHQDGKTAYRMGAQRRHGGICSLFRANYENSKLNVEKTQLPLEEFFKVLLFDEEIELKNRFLRIGAEYGSSVAAATGKIHRRYVGVKPKDVVVRPVDVAVNVVVKLTHNECPISAKVDAGCRAPRANF